MTGKIAVLSTLVFLSLGQIFVPAANAEESSWEQNWSKAQKAYAKRDLWSARKEFLAALKDARSKKQDKELAKRLEDLAGSYQQQDQNAMAEPLLKLARKVKSSASCT